MTTTAVYSVDTFRPADPAPLAHDPEPAYYITDAELAEHYRNLTLVSNTALTRSDVAWFDTWAPEVLEILEPLTTGRYVHGLSVEVFPTWTEYLEDCAWYGVDPDDPADAMLFTDAGLSGAAVVIRF